MKKEIQGIQQTINRLRQSGATDAERLLSNHREVAQKSLKYYCEMKDKCAGEWKEIVDLSSTDENSERLKNLHHKFTLILIEC